MIVSFTMNPFIGQARSIATKYLPDWKTCMPSIVTAIEHNNKNAKNNINHNNHPRLK